MTGRARKQDVISQSILVIASNTSVYKYALVIGSALTNSPFLSTFNREMPPRSAEYGTGNPRNYQRVGQLKVASLYF